jgi:hypothetical protein
VVIIEDTVFIKEDTAGATSAIASSRPRHAVRKLGTASSTVSIAFTKSTAISSVYAVAGARGG